VDIRPLGALIPVVGVLTHRPLEALRSLDLLYFATILGMRRGAPYYRCA